MSEEELSTMDQGGEATAWAAAHDLQADLWTALASVADPRPARYPELPPEAPWAEPSRSPHERARAVVAAMTTAEKCQLLHGAGLRVDEAGQRWQVYVRGVERLGIPDFTQADSPAGVMVGSAYAHRLPSEAALGATFDPEVVSCVAQVIGRDARELGYCVLHAPTLDVTRDPRHGRAHENFSEDPVLNARMGVAYVRGVQAQGVIADVKHFGLNTIESDRVHLNCEIDDRTLHELYLAPFRTVIRQAHPGMVMTCYAKVCGSHVNDSAGLLRDLLREEWGYDGIVRNDAGGVHSLDSLSLGLDQEFREEDKFGDRLKHALDQGRIDIAVVDQAVARILRTMFEFGLVDHPPRRAAELTAADADSKLQQAAERAIVLLKNDGSLPLDPNDTLRIAVIGAAADDAQIAGGPTFYAAQTDTVLCGLAEEFPRAHIDYYSGGTAVTQTSLLPGWPCIPARSLTAGGQAGVNVTFTAADGTVLGTGRARTIEYAVANSTLPGAVGLLQPPAGTRSIRFCTSFRSEAGLHEFDAACAGAVRLTVADQLVLDKAAGDRIEVCSGGIDLVAGEHRVEVTYIPRHPEKSDFMAVPTAMKIGLRRSAHVLDQDQMAAVKAATHADVAIVVARDIASEGTDRAALALPAAQDQLIAQVAAVNPRTVVVLATASAVLTPWREDVAAILCAWYGGARAGAALARMLAGRTEPAGRLPVSFPATESDLATAGQARFPGEQGQASFGEGLATGYRHYGPTEDRQAAYPFGFGLAYTQFAIEDAAVDLACLSQSSIEAADLDRPLVTVRVAVRNTGRRPGRAVIQLYLEHPRPATPAPVLADFQGVQIKAGERALVELHLTRENLEIRTNQRWRSEPGCYRIHVGQSARDLPFRLDLRIHS